MGDANSSAFASGPEANEHPVTGPPVKPPRRPRTRTVALVAMTAVVPLLVFLAIGLVQRSRNSRELASATSQAVSTPVRVFVVRPVASAPLEWSLPGTTQGIQDATIYARVSGYLSRRYVDIGDQVEEGQLLGEIESPELDQQLSQARANLRQASKQLDLQKANLELARTTMERYRGADQEGAVAKQAVDQAVAAYGTAVASVAAAEATVAANEATVRQYEAMTAFERVVAPFDGVVTQRNVDVGALITAGSPVSGATASAASASSAATGLFQVSRVDRLRVFVNVPQVVARGVVVGMPAQVRIRGALMNPVAATVTRTANALDPATRTLLTEVDIPNATRAMLPGEFVYVGFSLKPSGERWRLPATALIFNAQGSQVMVVDPGNTLRLQRVTVGRDFGSTIDVQAGLDGTETIVAQPGVSLEAGQVVTPTEAQDAP